MNYSGKVILAPMVRVGTLPMRLLALDYGADIVYSEELIDFKLMQCKRVENAVLGTVDFVWSDGSIIFRTNPREKGKLVLQIGTSDAKRAETVARLVEKDVDGIDVNMGCPKAFSVQGGMGVALLKQPENVQKILTTLVKAVSIPVTCKIRILDTFEETLALVKVMESTGITAIGIHGRTKNERPKDENHNDVIRSIAQSISIPVIANGGSGDLKTYDDIARFKEDTGAASVMIARAASYNVSLFRKDGLLPIETVINSYLKYAVDYGSHAINIKYCLQQMLKECLDTPRGRALQIGATVREICSLWGMEGYYDDAAARRLSKEEELRVLSGQSSVFKKRRLEDGTEIVEMPFKYIRKSYSNTNSPKMMLYNWTHQNKLPNPDYNTTENKADRMFVSVVHVNGKKYTSTIWDKSKKSAEQATAAVSLLSMGMSDGRRDFQIPGMVHKTSSTSNDALHTESHHTPVHQTSSPSDDTLRTEPLHSPMHQTSSQGGDALHTEPHTAVHKTHSPNKDTLPTEPHHKCANNLHENCDTKFLDTPKTSMCMKQDSPICDNPVRDSEQSMVDHTGNCVEDHLKTGLVLEQCVNESNNKT